MHAEAMRFTRETLDAHLTPEHRAGRVFEVGAYYGHDVDALGLVRRDYFAGASEYVGIDVRRGPGVDVVVPAAHLWIIPQIQKGERFDVMIASEVFEHDPYWRETVLNGLGLLRPGGLFVWTWATRMRAPHEHGMSPSPGWYAGVDLMDVGAWALRACSEAHFRLASGGEDAQAWGIR